MGSRVNGDVFMSLYKAQSTLAFTVYYCVFGGDSRDIEIATSFQKISDHLAPT